MSKKRYYFITSILFIFQCITNIYSQNSQYVDKQGGICFRIDDDNDASKYYEYAEVFNRQNKKFTYALNLAKDQITTDYVEMIKSLQANGHEMMDHTPWHRTNYFSTELGTDYYINHPGVSRINGSTIELKHKKVDINDSKRSGYVKIDGNIVTNSDGIFSNFSKTDCYLYFPSIDQLVFIDDRTGWIDEDTVIIRDIWRNSINLGFYDNIQFYNFDVQNVHLTVDAIRALAEETIRLSAHHNLVRPTSWIQPGGYFPHVYRSELKNALEGDLGYTTGGVFSNPSLKIFNEYNSNNDNQFGMDWGDFQLYSSPLEEVKTKIANRVAKNQVEIGSSHFNNLLNDDWDAYLERVENLLIWCEEKHIPVRTYSEWADILYYQTPNPYQNIFPNLNVDNDESGYPDGFEQEIKTKEEYVSFEGNWENNDGVDNSGNYSFSINKIGNICYVGKKNWWELDGLAGIEKGENDFEIWTKGAPGNFIEVDFTIGNNNSIYKFPAENSNWTKYNLSQSINGNNSLLITDNVSFIDIAIKCSDYSSGNVKISGMALFKKIVAKEFNFDLKVFLQGCYSNGNLMTTTINSSLPEAQPFNIEPWNYNGGEYVEQIPNENIVDWVLISLYKDQNNSNPNPLTSEHMISKAAFLLNNGKIVDLDGYSQIKITTFPGEYYIKIEHRNHLPVLSSQKVLLE